MIKNKVTTPYGFYYQYRDYDIELNRPMYGDKYSVQYCGDDILFDTEAEAEAFIDSLYEEVI